MSTKDKAREKLMSSMRKTKASASGQSTQSAEKPAEKPVAKAKPAAKKPAARSSDGGYSHRASSGDAYQSSGRIWPD
jgi:hypothetical protein